MVRGSPSVAATERALSAAFSNLSADGAGPDVISVRNLAEAAGVSTGTAHKWLKTRRDAAKPPSPVPADDLATLTQTFQGQIVAPIWARCLELARAEHKQDHADELMAAHDAMESAMQSAVVSERTAAAARVVAEQAQEKLQSAEAALADLRATRDVWVKEAQAARGKHEESRQLADEQARAIAALRGEITGLRAAIMAGPSTNQ